jgi:hypothetical protein
MKPGILLGDLAIASRVLLILCGPPVVLPELAQMSAQVNRHL